MGRYFTTDLKVAGSKDMRLRFPRVIVKGHADALGHVLKTNIYRHGTHEDGR